MCRSALLPLLLLASIGLAGCDEIQRQEPPPASPKPGAATPPTVPQNPQAPPTGSPTATPAAEADWFQKRLQGTRGSLDNTNASPLQPANLKGPSGLNAPAK